MIDSAHSTAHPGDSASDAGCGWLMTARVCTGREFNALRARLPRAMRQRTPHASEDNIGVIVQAVAPGDSPLATRCAVTRASDDTPQTIARLEAEVRRLLR